MGQERVNLRAAESKHLSSGYGKDDERLVNGATGRQNISEVSALG